MFGQISIDVQHRYRVKDPENGTLCIFNYAVTFDFDFLHYRLSEQSHDALLKKEEKIH